jgi:7,8-dihydropterin-6-yl-methyl-4-(beta-D-ribofuranosyl)aminobenzene 5'-phosphate synthase
MKNFFALLFSFILISAVFINPPALQGKQIEITILYDNYPFGEGLKTDWGFSCIIKGTEKTILFDTGTQGDIFLYNVGKLDVNLKDVEIVAISHNHGDHTGGLSTFLGMNSEVTVYLPASFPQQFFENVEQKGAKTIHVDKPVEICKDVLSTGELGVQIKEQSLVLNTNKGMIVITGCAHPGIVNIVRKAKEVLNEKIYLVFGGFHLLRKSDQEVKEIIKQFRELGVMNVGATHCTGDGAIKLFKEAYGENFIPMGVGKVIQISN